MESPGMPHALQPNMSFLTASDGLRLAWRVDDFTDPWRTPPTPVLLLHAAMGAYRRWFNWIPQLARQRTALSLELRGHGASEIPSEAQPLTVERLVADVVELLDHLGVARAHVVGLSAGGYVGQRLAMEYPDKVASLSLFASTPGLRNSQAGTWPAKAAAMGLEAFMRQGIADRFGPESDPGLVDWFCRQTGGNDLPFIGRFVAHMASRDWEDELPRIRCPTLLVAPGHEPIGSHDQYERMQALIPDARLISLEGMPHNIGDAAPEVCVKALLDFLPERD
jgi:pimeloyl-ACP methyl ester carboxylesterase